MRSHPGTDWFVALVVTALLCGGWPRFGDAGARPERALPWRTGVADLVVRTPCGWREAHPGGARCLMRDPSHPEAGVLLVRLEPDLGFAVDGAELGELAASAAARPGRTILGVTPLQIEGAPAARADWSSTACAARALRGTLVVIDRGAARVELELVAATDAWPAVERDVEALLASLAFDPR